MVECKGMDNTSYSIIISSKEYKNIVNPLTEKPNIEISIHQLNSPIIVIIYPGANGSKDGYENKYIRMAEKLVDSNTGAVIRSSNKYMLGNGWTTCLEIVIQYALEHSEEICGSKNYTRTIR